MSATGMPPQDTKQKQGGNAQTKVLQSDLLSPTEAATGLQETSGALATVVSEQAVMENDSEEHAAEAIERGDNLALEAYEQIMAATVARALQGNMDAVREIRVGVIEPRRARVSRRKQPTLSAVVLAALRQLPVKYEPPADAIDAEVIPPESSKEIAP